MAKGQPKSAAELRLLNRNRVYRHLYSATGIVTKQELAYALKMSLPTLTQNLTELLEAGLIDNSEVADSTGGRRPHIFSVVPDARFAIGVELSSGHIRMIAADLLLHELSFQIVPRPFQADKQYGAELAQAIERFIDENGLIRDKLLGVGITIPGVVDKQQISFAPTLNIQQCSVELLTQYIPYPTHLTNDANAGGFAEWWNRSHAESMAYLSLSRGVGGAIMTNGVTYLGLHSRSGEFGHMCILPQGKACSCGRRGCLEAYCSTARLSDDLGITLEQFFSALAAKDQRCVQLWEDYLSHLAVGINNIHAALDCDIVLGGKLSQFLPDQFDTIDAQMRSIDPDYYSSPYLCVCRYHERSNGIGAALYFIDQFINSL